MGRRSPADEDRRFAPPAPAVTTADIRAGAWRRLVAGLAALPGGIALAAAMAWAASRLTPALGGWALFAIGAVADVAVLVPRVRRSWRLWRADRRDRRTSATPAVPVRIAVYASGRYSAVPALVAVWSADRPDGTPRRVDAADRSARPLIHGGRMWATVAGAPHRRATYRLDDGTPVVAVGRVSPLQRWLVRDHVRDLRRRALSLDRRMDAPYPRPATAAAFASELTAAITPMAVVAVLLLAVGVLGILPAPSPRGLLR